MRHSSVVFKIFLSAIVLFTTNTATAALSLNSSLPSSKVKSTAIIITEGEATMSKPQQSSVIEIATLWAQNDPNEHTSSYINDLIQKVTNFEKNKNHEEESSEEFKTLQSLFPTDGSRIGFGTAGLRSAMKPGPLGMNDLVIIQATQGLAKYIEQQQTTQQSQPRCEGKKLIAVIGYDHRKSKPEFKLSSKKFALLTKLAFLQAGFECILLDGFVPTPLIAFSTTKLGADVGIMITASHNPKNDAGMKITIGSVKPFTLF